VWCLNLDIIGQLSSLRRIFFVSILGIKKNINKSEISLIKALTTKSLFIDGGANIGKISKLVIQQSENPDLEIMAFEPDPMAFAQLALIQGEKFQAYEKALFVENGIATLFRHKEFTSNFSTTSSTLNHTKSNIGKDNSIQVNVIDIVDVVRHRELNSIVMKLDVEGSEYEILSRLLKTRQMDKFSMIFCEFHPHKIRFGVTKHLLLFTRLKLSRNLWKIKNWA
jgi:FkbM family methyltransferase